MTKKELSRYYEMSCEYIKQKNLLEELQKSLFRCQGCYAGNCSKNRKLKLYITILKKLMGLTLMVCDYEKIRIQQFIDKVPDCKVHQILRLRYINTLSWNQVATSMNGDLSGRSVKKINDKYLNPKEYEMINNT